MKAPWSFKISFLFLLAFLCLVYGFLISRAGWWPSQTAEQIWQMVRTYRIFGTISPVNRLVVPARGAARKPFVIYEPDRMMDGYFAFLGWDSDRGAYAVSLYNAGGKLLHTWVIDYAACDPDGPHLSDQPHGLVILPDGSVVLTWDGGDVMARLDGCGKPVWVTKGYFHHLVNQAEDGTLWVWRGMSGAYSQYQYLVNLDAETGKVLRQISLVDDIIKKMADPAEVFLLRADYPFRPMRVRHHSRFDIFHPNEIEVLPRAYAAAFPMFKPGDLLISLKMLNLVAVLDPASLEIKWWSHGPWRWQHDPDFTPDGAISVYNNNADLNRSEIIKIDPGSKRARNELAGGNLFFYTRSMGTHQYLPNGNVLISVPSEGRVVLASPGGDKVMEYNNIYGDKPEFNGNVENAVWLPPDYFPKLPLCPR